MDRQGLIELLKRVREDAAVLLDNEQATKLGIILPILGRLGWDRDNVREVVPEYSVGTGRVDFCLRLGHRNAAFIEAKRANQELDRHQEQLLDYAFREGVELAALTNGLIWRLFLPLLGGSWDQRKFFTIDIGQQGADAASDHFISFLAREAVASGEALTRARAVYQSREKERLTNDALPKAWRLLCEEPDEMLSDLLTERVEGLCGYKPTPDQVARFLQGAAGADSRAVRPRPVEPPPPPVSTREPRETRKRPSAPGVYTFARPRAYTLFGQRQPVSSFQDLLMGVCITLAAREGTGFERVLQLKGRRRDYFSRDSRGMTNPKELPNTGIFIETNLSANDIVRRCYQVLGLFGHKDDVLRIEVE